MKSFVRAALGILTLVCSCSLAGATSPPQASRQGVEPVSVETLHGGTVQLRRGARKVSLNLGSDIAGCKSRLYDPMEHVSSDADVRLETVDETRQGDYTYLVLLAGAPPNCNVQGECGAGEESLTLVWLKLDKDLKLAGKQAFAVDECLAQRSIRIEGKDVLGPDLVEIKASDLPWDDDVLRVAYQVRDEKVQRFIYDRRNPDAGFQKVSP